MTYRHVAIIPERFEDRSSEGGLVIAYLADDEHPEGTMTVSVMLLPRQAEELIELLQQGLATALSEKDGEKEEAA